MTRARIGSAALGIASVALGFGLVESGARLATDPPRYHALNHLEFHPELGLRQIPGLAIDYADEAGPFEIRLSSEGFRGRELPQPDAQTFGATRIAFIGDSFLVGLALREENLLTSRTERALSDLGRAAEVYNLSSTDYGTAQELLLLRRAAARIRPEVVVLSLYPANDVANNAIELAGRTTGSPGDYIRPYLVARGDEFVLTWVHPGRALLRRHLRTFALLERGALGLGRRYGIEWLDPWREPATLSQRLRAGLAPTEELEIHRREPRDPAWRSAWETTFRLLRAVRDECAAINAKLLVIVIPRFVQVHRDATAMHTDMLVRQAGARSLDGQLDWNEPERTLAEFFRRERIDARILLDPFRAATAERAASIYLRDGHLDARAHDVAAREIVDWFANGATSGAPQSTEPVSLLPPAEQAPAKLDFASGRYEPFLVLGVGGWLEYRSHDSGGSGWMTGSSAQLVLPARRADLVVRGRLGVVPRLPVQVVVRLVGGDKGTVSLDAPGPFEIRLPHPVAPSLRGYVVIELNASPTTADTHGLSGLLIEEIGFEGG